MTDPEKAEYEDVLRRLTAKCEELVAENTRLRSSENTAHSVLREVYNDPSASPHVRVLAAKAAISHESAPLKPIAQMELKAEPAPLPLAEKVRLQRMRVKAIEGLPYDHPRVKAWIWPEDETQWAEHARRLTEGSAGGTGQDGNGGTGDSQS
jgi:hypothetical protein